MKKYSVNVHYDVVVSVDVVAESEREALELAEQKAGYTSLDTEGEVVDTKSCVTDEEEIADLK